MRLSALDVMLAAGASAAWLVVAGYVARKVPCAIDAGLIQAAWLGLIATAGLAYAFLAR